MARMPGALWQGEHSPKTPMTHVDIVCVHTIVGHPPAHAAHFSTEGDGTIYQSRDTAYRSAANLEGNYRIIAVENEDMGPEFGEWANSSSPPPLTDKQIDAIAEILAWAHKVHGVPLQLCPDSKPGSRGLAYHRQGIDGNFGPFRFGGRVSGGEVWTVSRGKVCPGDNRIAQLPEILKRAKALVDGTPQEVHMNNVQQVQDIIDNMLTEGRKARALIQRVPKSRTAVRAADWRLVLINRALISLQKFLPKS